MSHPDQTPDEEKPCPHCGQGIPASTITRWAGQLTGHKRKRIVGGFKDPERARAAALKRWENRKKPSPDPKNQGGQ